MKIFNRLTVCIGAALSLFAGLALTAAPAQAQATRTWVSGVGDDVNPCSRTAPCKTFAGAISKTAAGGEINCLDPGGYGTITITKSITIDCTGTFGSILNSGGINGVNINDSASATPGTIDVKLRGLSIDGAGTTPGLNGIRFVSGRSLTVEDLFIQNQLNNSSGAAILVNPSANTANVTINNTVMTHNVLGVDAVPSGTGVARVMLNNVQIARSTTNGVRANATTRPVAMIIENSVITAGTNGVSAIGPNASSAQVLVSGSNINLNGSSGIVGNGLNARVRVANSVVTANNGTGINPTNGSFINDLGGNVVVGNTPDGAFN